MSKDQGHVSFSDTIHKFDVQQSDPATARVCGKDPSHGRLTMHGNGHQLVCGNKLDKLAKNCCNYAEPISRD